ncbi:hypothetical protein D3C85_1581400 [compost metagenome]
MGTRCANITDSTGACNGAGAASYQAGFDTTIKTIAANVSGPSVQAMNCNGKQYSGAWYNSADGKSAVIHYYLRGNQECTAGSGLRVTGRYQADDTTVCIASLPTL